MYVNEDNIKIHEREDSIHDKKKKVICNDRYGYLSASFS